MSNAIEFMLYLYAESPVHAGGADSIGALDLPIQREATTTYPVIWGQSLKGALRQAAADANWPQATMTAVFGTAIEGERSDDDAAGRGPTQAGTLAVGDAQLVAMPVPTLRRTFAWVTSGLALARLRRKYALLSADAPAVPQAADDAGAAASEIWAATGRPPEVLGPCLVGLGGTPSAELATWAERIAADALDDPGLFGQMAAKLRTDLLLVGDDIMPTLLRECTEFVARVQLTEDKTVRHGPFYSEYLPVETVLATSLSLRPTSQDTERTALGEHQAKLTELLHGKLLQVGGDETLGKGLMWARLVGGGAA